MLIESPNTILETALSYARRGWRVFPLFSVKDGRCTCGQESCKAGKHPRIMSWQEKATTDKEQITKWFGMWPDSNIAIATGKASNLVVLDVDTEGAESLSELQAKYGRLPETVEAITGSGGRHIYFKHPDTEVRNSVSTLGDGLDVRSEGGYVVAPPSKHVSGREYMWEPSSHPDEVQVAEMPTWLLELLVGPKQTLDRPTIAEITGIIPEGKRNDILTSLAGTMRRRGMSEEAIRATLLEENEAKCNPPLSEQEVENIAQSVSKYEPADSTVREVKETPLLPIERVRDWPTPPPLRYTVEDMIPEGYINLLYGDSGQGKSYLAFTLAFCVAAGIPFIDQEVITGNVLYLDFELDKIAQARRVDKIMKGLGINESPAGLFYLSPGHDGVPSQLPLLLDSMKATIKEKDISLTVLDSFGAALIGDALRDSDVAPFMQSLRDIGTVIILDHQRRLQQGEQYRQIDPYGNGYKKHLSRNVWQIEKLPWKVENEAKLLLRHKKANFGPLKEDIHLLARFGERFELVRREADEGDAQEWSAIEQVHFAFKVKKVSDVPIIAQELSMPERTVREAVENLEKQGSLKFVGKGGASGRAPQYELVEKR